MSLGPITNVPYVIQKHDETTFTIVDNNTEEDVKTFTTLEAAEEYLWTNLVDQLEMYLHVETFLVLQPID